MAKLEPAGVPNLTKMSRADLIRFAARHWNGSNAEELFHDADSEDVRHAVAVLARYAFVLEGALAAVHDRTYRRARRFKLECTAIYARLPPFARFPCGPEGATRSER